MSDRKPLRDYNSSRAVLVGTSRYTYLPEVGAADNSLDRMSNLLIGELCGWPKERVSIIRNERGPGDLPDRLITLFEEVTDVALFYFVGHGQMDIEDQLCLGLVDSRTEPHRRAYTSLQFHAIRRAMIGSPAKTKIVILDCCFAGLANTRANTLGALDLLDRAGATGAYTMAACGSFSAAWFEDEEGGQTYFTRYLADLIESGIPDEAPVLRLRTIFDRLREKLARDDRPLPEDRSIDSAGDFLFAHNAFQTPHYPTDREATTAEDYELILDNYSALVSNLARRTQSLIEKQISLLSKLEQTEENEDQFSNLLRLDHLATRMRRYSENLLVLTGREATTSQSRQSMILLDVLRAAISEIEMYHRVDVTAEPGVLVIGQATNDIVHLVAEIVENATVFSPDDTPVNVSGKTLPTGGVLLDITDNGVGISEQEMAHANWRLDNPPVVDVAASRRMGLFVVGRLAARHGIRVRLRHSQSGGVTALVWLPGSVVSAVPSRVGMSQRVWTPPQHSPVTSLTANTPRIRP